MTRFFFDLSECSTLTRDEEGVELNDAAAALRYALQAAREVMAAEVREGRLCLGCAIAVRTADSHAFDVRFRDALRLTGI